MKKYDAEKNARLVYRLLSLGMAGSVLHIGAHPDDEDIGLLAYLSNKFGVRAVYWSATRGEGGQNRIGPYRDEALGIYRTWESLAARDIDGGECLLCGVRSCNPTFLISFLLLLHPPHRAAHGRFGVKPSKFI